MTTPYYTKAQQRTINKIKEVLTDNPKGLNFEEIVTLARKNPNVIQVALEVLGKANNVKFDDVEQLYFWVDNPTTETAEVVNETETNTEIATPKPKNRYKRFSPNKVTGFMLEKAKIRVFLDRRASSHTATLSLDDFEMLAGALGYVKGD